MPQHPGKRKSTKRAKQPGNKVSKKQKKIRNELINPTKAFSDAHTESVYLNLGVPLFGGIKASG